MHLNSALIPGMCAAQFDNDNDTAKSIRRTGRFRVLRTDFEALETFESFFKALLRTGDSPLDSFMKPAEKIKVFVTRLFQLNWIHLFLNLTVRLGNRALNFEPVTLAICTAIHAESSLMRTSDTGICHWAGTGNVLNSKQFDESAAEETTGTIKFKADHLVVEERHPSASFLLSNPPGLTLKKCLS